MYIIKVNCSSVVRECISHFRQRFSLRFAFSENVIRYQKTFPVTTFFVIISNCTSTSTKSPLCVFSSLIGLYKNYLYLKTLYIFRNSEKAYRFFLQKCNFYQFPNKFFAKFILNNFFVQTIIRIIFVLVPVFICICDRFRWNYENINAGGLWFIYIMLRLFWSSKQFAFLWWSRKIRQILLIEKPDVKYNLY